jgi:hypothetical protein
MDQIGNKESAVLSFGESAHDVVSNPQFEVHKQSARDVVSMDNRGRLTTVSLLLP